MCENTGVDRAMDSPLNFPVLRFADVLLMQAEALNELGRSSEAAAPASSENDGGPLNRVRVRAGLPNVTTTDQVELREIIRHERRMELAFEVDTDGSICSDTITMANMQKDIFKV